MNKKNIRWAIKTLLLSISLSMLFSVICQSLLPNLSILMSIFLILIFITISILFDMISVAVTSAKLEYIEKFKNKRGFITAKKLIENTEKVSSFCGDVVGDICGIISGAGGVSLTLNLQISNLNIYFLTTCLVSSLIAGTTIFGKAIMKRYAVENSVKVVMFVAKMFEPKIFQKNLK